MSADRGICVVAPGGGCRTAYNAGVMRAIHERFGLSSITRVVGISGGLLNWAYAASGRVDYFEPFWVELIASGRFIRPWRHPTGRGIMDIDFMVDDMVKERYPLDLGALKHSSMRVVAGVTHSVTARGQWFGVQDVPDFREVIRASCAPPYIYGKHVVINGQPYCDGGIANPTGIRGVIDENRILVVLTFSQDRKGLPLTVRRFLRWLLLRNESEALQEAIFHLPEKREEEIDRIYALRKRVRVAIIRPKAELPSSRVDSSLNHLRATIAQGYQDTYNHPELEDFFTK